MSIPADDGAALCREHERQPRAAADVEHAGARADAGCVEHGLEQRPVVRLGELAPRRAGRSPTAGAGLAPHR